MGMSSYHSVVDNITHTLAALAISRAGLDRLTPRAPWLLAFAANIPDIDVVAAAFGSHAYLDAHRGPTHGLPMAPLMAAVPVLALGLARRPAAWGVALVGVLSHLALDWTNIYGIRLLSPLSDQWYRLDIAAVVDPVVWALLLFGALWPVLAKLVASEIGSRRRGHAGLARAVLLAIAAYLGARYFLHERALNMLESRVYPGGGMIQAAAMPDALNPMRWRGLVETDSTWQIHALRVDADFDPTLGRILHKAFPSRAIDSARATPPFQALERFSRTLIWQATPMAEPEATEVVATDLRFAMPGEGRFAARAVVDAGGRVLESGYRFTPPGAAPRPR
jgi:inner membrane protein